MSYFRLHRVAALVVLGAAAAWVSTGQFAAVGTAKSEDQSSVSTTDPAAAPAEIAPLIRTVSAVTPEFADHARIIRLSGTTSPEKRTVLAARSEGIIHSLSLVKGASVPADAIIMMLEGPQMVAQQEIAQIALDKSERDLVLAERSFASGNTPEVTVNTARSARDAAAAQLTLAQAAVDRLQLKTPFAGIVDGVDVELGEWVQAGAPIATILSLDPILVNAEVSEIDVGHVHGRHRRPRSAWSTAASWTARCVSSRARRRRRPAPSRSRSNCQTPDRAIPAGMTAELVLYAPPVRAVAVPRSIITLSADGDVGCSRRRR